MQEDIKNNLQSTEADLTEAEESTEATLTEAEENTEVDVEQGEEDEHANPFPARNLSPYVRALAGGYLLYLAYQIFQGSREEIAAAGFSGRPILYLFAAVLFLACGAVFIWSGVKEIKKDKNR